MNRILKNIVYHLPWLLSDKRFLELSWELHMGYALDIDKASSFNEKIQWLKLYDRKDEYTRMADKESAKECAAAVIGYEHIIPTIGVWDRVEDIPWADLPNQFVIKCTHDSGGLVICRDKASLDIPRACIKLDSCLKRNFYKLQREWAYKGIKPRIIAETLMEDERQKTSLVDYKFFCFNGKPQFMYVSEGLEDHSTASITFADLQGNVLPFHRADYKAQTKLSLPGRLAEMVEMADALAKASCAPFIRIDLYEVGGQIYFSEYTFYPNSGFIPFSPAQWDMKLGELLKL